MLFRVLFLLGRDSSWSVEEWNKVGGPIHPTGTSTSKAHKSEPLLLQGANTVLSTPFETALYLGAY